MKFEDHIHEFLGDSVDETEARGLAVAAIAGSLRQFKYAIAERLWQARQAGAEAPDASAAALGAARTLRGRFDAALSEYRRLVGVREFEPEFTVIEGGQETGSDSVGAPDGGA